MLHAHIYFYARIIPGVDAKQELKQNGNVEMKRKRKLQK